MAVQFVSFSTTTSGSMATEPGDLVIAFVTRTNRTVPSAWTSLGTANYYDATTLHSDLAYQVATGTSVTKGSWGYGSVSAYFAVYRGVHQTDPVRGFRIQQGFANSSGILPIGLPTDRLSTSGVAAGLHHPNLNTGYTPPWPWTTRRLYRPLLVMDAMTSLSSWASSVDVSVNGALSTGVYFSVEIAEALIEKSTAGAVSLDISTPAGTPVKAAPVVSAGQDAWQPVPIPNGTFETSLSGWSGTFFGETLSEITRDTTVKRTGTASMKIEARRDLVGSDGVFDTGTTFSNTDARIKGGRYRLSAWVYADDSCDEFGFGAWFDNSIPWVTTTTKGAWVNLVTEGVLDPNRDYISLAFDVKGTNAVGWVDDITIEYLAVGNPLDLTVAGEVVKSEGEIKPTGGQVALPPFAIGAGASKSGAVKAFTITDAEGLPLSLALTGTTIKETGVNGPLPLNLPVAGTPSKSVTRDGSMGLRLALSGRASRVEENLTGLLTRLVAYAPNGDRLGPLPGFQSWNVTIPYGTDLGAFDGEYPWQAPRSDVISEPVEVALEVHDGERFVEQWDCRWLVLNHGWDENDPTVPINASGVSMGVHLAKTTIKDGPTDGWTVGERRFTTATAGRYMTTLCAEAKARGALAGVDVSTFNADTDSAGTPWSQVISMGFTVGTPLSQAVEALVQQGMMEVRWSGRKLLLFDAQSSSIDRTTDASPVVLTAGRDLKSAPVQSTIADVATTALVRGDEGLTVEVSNPEAASPWGRWETTLDQSGVSADGLEDAGRNVVASTAVGRSQHTNALNFVGARHLPLLGYQPGDWVISAPGPSSEARDRYRLRQITLSMDSDGIVGGSAVLNDIIVEADVRLKRRLDGVQGGASNAGPMPRPVQGDNTTPAAPTNLAATTTVYVEEKQQRAQVALTWQDPTVNTDGTPLDDLNMIQVWAKPSRPGTSWRFLTAARAGQQQVTFGPLEVAETYSFRLTAIDFTGHTSPESNTVTLTMARDVTGPPQPAAPTTDSRNGVVEVSHNGKTNQGGEQPIDFSHFEVYAHTSSSFSATTTYRVGTIAADASSLALTNWPYNRSIYARVVAVDVSGNRSTLSPVSAPAYNDQVGGGDIADNAVGAGELNVPAIDSAGNLNVNQLTGKTITGVTINGGLFRSTNTSQRVEIGDTGPNDPVDEIRMFNGGTVSSIRNPSDRPGALRINASNTVWNLYRESDGHPVMQSSGRGALKWLTSASGLQARTANDAGFAPMAASEFIVSSEQKFKTNIVPAGVDATAAVKATQARRWNWRWDDPGKPSERQMGLVADELPEEVRTGDGYSVTAVVALLWDALREANERIEVLERRRGR